VINHLWQSTVFAILAAILTLAFRKNRAQVRYWLWLSASLKFLVPFSLLMSLGSHIEWAPAAHLIATPVVSSTMVQFTQPFPETVSLVPSTTDTSDWIPMTILAVWACGFAAVALMRLRGWLRITATVRSSSPLEMPVPLDVRSAPGLLEPGVVGFLRPILLLPEGIAECLTTRQLEAVLAHELCHVRRRDNLTSAIHMIVEAIFWFHPLVWWIGARLIEERERACDEAVLSLGNEPQVYAEGILNVCKIYVESPLRCVSGVTGSDLKKRIQAILTGRIARELNFAKRVALAVAGIAAMALPVIVGVMNAPAIRAQSSTGAPKFEVATVKPTDPTFNGRTVTMPLNDGLITLKGWSLRGLIQFAWGSGIGLHRSLLSGGPTWFDRDRFDIVAKADGAHIPSQDERKQMLKGLLTERFHLEFHRESKQIPVYALVVGRNGAKMKARKPDDDGAPFSLQLNGFRMPGRNASMAQLADILQSLIPLTDPDRDNRPIVDKTGLTGKFDFDLHWAPDPTLGGARGGVAVLANEPDIFIAVEEQLGLKLESQKAPMDVLVIDHTDRPSEN
jgi:bla regulator protein blaR1